MQPVMELRRGGGGNRSFCPVSTSFNKTAVRSSRRSDEALGGINAAAAAVSGGTVCVGAKSS